MAEKAIHDPQYTNIESGQKNFMVRLFDNPIPADGPREEGPEWAREIDEILVKGYVDEDGPHVIKVVNGEEEEIGGEGSTELKVLASGTYTTGNSVTNLTIPVQYTGTPLYAYLYADTITEGSAQNVFGFIMPASNIVEGSRIPSAYIPNGIKYHTDISATGAYTVGRTNSGGQFQINANNLFFGRVSPSQPWMPNTEYHWVIVGF